MEKSGLMPVECVMAGCDSVIWRAYRAPTVVLRKRVNHAKYWASDMRVSQRRLREEERRGTENQPPEVPEHPTFQEYCRVCMTRIRGVEQDMLDAVDAKDLGALNGAIALGKEIHVDTLSIDDAEINAARLLAEEELLAAQNAVNAARQWREDGSFQTVTDPALDALRATVATAHDILPGRPCP